MVTLSVQPEDLGRFEPREQSVGRGHVFVILSDDDEGRHIQSPDGAKPARPPTALEERKESE
jgi:hypothetical protein